MAIARIFAVAVVLLTTCQWNGYAKTAKATIEGPTESKAGNLVVLNTGSSKADATQWIIPDELDGRFVHIGTQLAFSVRESGRFKFYLVAVSHETDETAAGQIHIDVAAHTVTITDGFGECKPGEPVDPVDPIDPINPVDPEPPIEGYRQIEDLSRESARRLDDPSTATSLANVLRQIRQASLAEMRKSVSDAVEAVFAMRRGPSEGKAWDVEWRKPLDQAVEKLGITTSEQYQKVLAAISKGLIDSVTISPSPNPPQLPTVQITFYTQGDACSWCVKWKREVKPVADAVPGWIITSVATTGSAPQFDVRVGNKVQRLVGYQTLDSLTSTVQALQKP